MRYLSVVLAVMLAVGTVACQEKKIVKSDIKDFKDSVSYSIGFDIGKNLTKNNIPINPRVFYAALREAMEDTTQLLTQDEMMGCMQKLQEDMMKQQAKKSEGEAKGNKDAGKKFLEENAKKEGVVVLPSGLQYKILESGKGKTPTKENKVKCHYKGTLIDGKVFDSSIDRGEPIEFSVGGVIKGWTEALQLMKEGDKWMLYIPSDLGYGDQGTPGGPIPPGATLIFEVQLLEVK